MTDRSKVKTVTQVKSNQPCENKRQALSQIKRIDWSSLDFRTLNQKSFYRTIGRNDVTFCVGPAGCGKTYLPGDIDEKTAPYMMSLYYNMEQIIGKQRLDVLRSSGVVTVIPLAYMRGLTLTNSIVVLDEAQNATPSQIKTFLTRIGNGSKFIVNGDLMQSDIKISNGLEDSIKRFTGLRRVGFSQFNLDDVVRHPIVAELLERYKDEYELGVLSAEETLSMWLEKQEYDEPKHDNYFFKLRN